MDGSAPFYQTLHAVFGFDQFLPGQEEVIDRLIDGRSVLAVFPTGQGKSLCYQLTALHFPGLTLVVSPLVALMKDQVDFLADKNIKAARLDSSLGREEFDRVQADLIANRLKILYVAPERFANERFLTMLKRLSISMLVIDEAHCISEWGHNFRPDYLKLAQFRTDLQIPTVLALTATATPRVADDIRAAFAIMPEDFVHTGFYRPNLCLRFSVSNNPLQLLLERLAARPQASTIVYVTLQATAEQVAGELAAQGYPARAYHAGMKDEERHAVQDWFMDSSTAIVVATIAFGMGIDKPDIRYVYHYNLPKSLENYAQEIGRAGRDNKAAVCEMLGSADDLTVLENFVYGDTPEPDEINRMVRNILGNEDWFSLSIYETSHEYDMRALVVNTLLTYLELEDIIASTGPFYTSYKFVPHRSSAEIFSRFDTERAAFLRMLFSCARKGRKWFTLDLDEVVEKTSADRQRVVAALNYLEEIGDLELQATGARRGFRFKRRPTGEETAVLIEKLQKRFLRREQNDIQRISMLVSMACHAGCKTNYLLSYFGEDRSENCGHCEYCLADEKEASVWEGFLRREAAAITPAHEERIRTVIAESHDALHLPRQQARFFCGLRSPRTTRAGLHRHGAFGLLAEVPFQDVLNHLEG
jgi:ATP-dependent DNA helicase RecQ